MFSDARQVTFGPDNRDLRSFHRGSKSAHPGVSWNFPPWSQLTRQETADGPEKEDELCVEVQAKTEVEENATGTGRTEKSTHTKKATACFRTESNSCVEHKWVWSFWFSSGFGKLHRSFYTEVSGNNIRSLLCHFIFSLTIQEVT